MKRKKLLLIALSMALLTSCSEESKLTSAYEYTLDPFTSSNAADLGAVEIYLRELDIYINDSFYIEGTSRSNNNVQALVEFNKATQRISVDKLETMGLSYDATFTLNLVESEWDSKVLSTWVFPPSEN